MIEKVSKERMEICRGCKFNSENRKKEGYKTVRLDEHCTNCGCTLSAKTACLSCECPLEEKKWNAITSQEEYDGIKQLIGKQGSEDQESAH